MRQKYICPPPPTGDDLNKISYCPPREVPQRTVDFFYPPHHYCASDAEPYEQDVACYVKQCEMGRI